MQTFSADEKKRLPLFTRFINSEMKKIDIDKWCEGCSKEKDPGQEYIIKWIKENADWFREAWNKSSCKVCKDWENCGWKVICNCKKFKSYED